MTTKYVTEFMRQSTKDQFLAFQFRLLAAGDIEMESHGAQRLSFGIPFDDTPPVLDPDPTTPALRSRSPSLGVR